MTQRITLESLPGIQLMKELDLEAAYKTGTTKDGAKFNHLSPSGSNDMAACSMKYKFSRIDKLPTKQALPLIYGNALHDGYEVLMNQKMRGEAFDVSAIWTSPVDTGHRTNTFKPFDEVWYGHVGEDWADQVPTKDLLELEHVRLENSFKNFIAEDGWGPKLDPVFTEPLVISPIPGSKTNLHLLGFIDLGAYIDGVFYLVDHKSAKTLPSKNKFTGEYEVSADYRQQLTAYAAAVWNWKLPEAGQPGALLYTSKDLSPEQIWVPAVITQDEVNGLARKLCAYGEIINQGLFTFNRSYGLCSPKFCSFWKECHEQFG